MRDQADDLAMVATLIRDRNAVDRDLAKAIGRWPHDGAVAEIIAACVFDINLAAAANNPSSDGEFRTGPLAGKSVNIKYRRLRRGLINLGKSSDPRAHPDYYLQLTGRWFGVKASSRADAPFTIEEVHLFESEALLAVLRAANRQSGVGGSFPRDRWRQAMIFPQPMNRLLPLTEEQRVLLTLFAGDSIMPSSDGSRR